MPQSRTVELPRSATSEASNPARKKKKTNLEKSGNKAVNFLNSDKWSAEKRPPHLMDDDDDVFNMLSGHDDQQ